MLRRVSTTITTNSSGAATVFLGGVGPGGVNGGLLGYLHALNYYPGTLDTGADLTVTCERSLAPILTKVNLGTGNSWLYPRALPTNANSATGPLGTIPSERIPLVNERIKVVVAQGGNTLTGTIEAIYETCDV